MAWFRRDRAKTGKSANEIVSRVRQLRGGKAPATVISATALVFSGFSLWESSLKQADLSVYVTGVVAYERDLTADEYIQPAGGFEVLAVPITTGWLDRALGTPVEPVTLTLNMPDIPGDRVARGELVRLRPVEARL
jgi:hypothetical protein